MGEEVHKKKNYPLKQKKTTKGLCKKKKQKKTNLRFVSFAFSYSEGVLLGFTGF